MTFDYELALLTIKHDENALGDPIEIPVRRLVLCDVLSVTRGEHYQAAAHGLKPEIVFVVNKYEYQDEQEIEFEGREYRVMRTYEPKRAKGIGDFETIELVCAGVVSRGSTAKRSQN